MVVATDGNKLAAVVAGKTVRIRDERVTYLVQTVAENVPAARLDQLVPLSNPQLRRRLESAPLVLVTAAEEIDGLCENTPALARRMLDDVFNQLRCVNCAS